MIPKVMLGGFHSDERGNLFYNNDVDLLSIKRIYVIENSNVDFIRGWQGHKIEKRWFSAIYGSFQIQLVEIDDWDRPSKNLKLYTFQLDSTKLDILHAPQGYISSIQSLKVNSKLLVMADYSVNEINDEYRLPLDYFEVRE